MKNYFFAAIVLAVLGICLTARAGYSTDVAVAPGTDVDTYLIKVKVAETTADGKESLLSAPKMLLKAGLPGHLVLGGEQAKDGMSCDVVVKQNNGVVEATAKITVKKDGVEVFTTTQTLSVQSR